MSSKYKFRDQDKLYFVSFAVVYWLDVFIRNEYKEIILNSLKYCQREKGLEVYGWCLMTSHMHMIIGTQGKNMEDIMRDFKSFTSTSLKEAIKENVQESRKEWLMWMMERSGKLNSNNNGFQFWDQDNDAGQVMQARIGLKTGNFTGNAFKSSANSLGTWGRSIDILGVATSYFQGVSTGEQKYFTEAKNNALIALGSELTPLTGLVATVYAFHEATLTNEEKANYCLKEANTYWNNYKESGNAVNKELAESFHRLYFKYSGIDMNNRKFVLKQGKW